MFNASHTGEAVYQIMIFWVTELHSKETILDGSSNTVNVYVSI